MEAPKKDWLEKRKRGIGGSDVAAICGVSPYKTPLQVWEEKRSAMVQDFDNDAMFWGRTLEPVIRQRYSDVTGRPVKLPAEMLVHPTYPFILGNIDGFTDDRRGVEIKTTAYPTGWGEPGTDEIPVGYIFQVQHYMMITGFPVFDVPVLIGGRDFRIYEVPEDLELQDMILNKEAEFWEMVQTGTPPAPVSYDDVIRLYRQSEAKTVTATEKTETYINELRKVREEIKRFDCIEEALKKVIMEFMAEADTLVDLKGNTLATWKTGKPVKRFDTDRFKKEQDNLYKMYLKESEPQRRFLMKGEK